jgi:photosystem II stability/assembly factor-like uncharacterized protein
MLKPQTLVKLLWPIALISLLFASVYGQENLWICNGPYGGSVKTIAIHPFDRERIFAGTIQNCIYKTTDGGQNWSHIECQFERRSMRVIAIHPTAPDTMYAATVSGMYKSTDGGDNWALMHPPENELNEYRAFAINPAYPHVLFAGGPFDRWRSTDSGQNWQELNISSSVGVDRFTVDSRFPYIVYLVSGSVGLGMGIWKSSDTGETWVNIQNNIDSVGFGEDLAIDPVDSNILYFALRDVFRESGRCLWKSLNGGESWYDITPDILAAPEVLAVRISPINREVIFLCTSEDGVLRSLDGGYSWERKNDGVGVVEIATMEIDPVTGIIYLGTYHDGVYKSIDDGEAWEKISMGIPLTTSHDLSASYADPSIVYVAARNGLFRTMDGGESWGRVDLGSPYVQPTTVKFDRFSTEYIYVSSTPYPQLNPSGLFRSLDGGDSWALFQQGLPPDSIAYTDMAISYESSHDRVIFLACTQGVYVSADSGETWTLCGNGLPGELWYPTIAAAPSDPDLVVAGSLNNRMFFSEDRGNSWYEIPDIPGNDRILDAEFDPDDSSLLYVSFRSSGLFKTTDRGLNWIDITNNLPWEQLLSIRGIAINPFNRSNMFVYVGFHGVYQSHDQGATWEAFNEGLDTASLVGCLLFSPDDTTKLFLSTSPRSVWSISRSQTGIRDREYPESTPIALSVCPNPFNSETDISFSIHRTEYVTLAIYNLLGQHVKTICDGFRPAGLYSFTWDASNLNSGVYFASLKTLDAEAKIKILLLK